jgi:putative membrane protein
MAGSLRKIWPWKDTLTTRINSHGETVPVLQKNILPEAFDLSLLFAVLLFVGAAFMMWKLSKFMKNEDVIDS